MLLADFFALLALLGTLLTTVQALLVRRFGGLKPAAPPRPEFVSILKPVCGLDDELEENLRSFTQLHGLRYEVIISAEEWEEPALEVARRVMREHPEAPFRIVVDGGSRAGVVNRKVERLIAAARVAKGDVFFISDSNVRVEADDVARTLAALDDPRTGCVSNVFTGSGARTLGATIESLHLLGFVAPGAVLAAAARVPCVVGKSMAITRAAHDAIGGFARFRRVLAEDQAIGLAVREAGYHVVLSPVTVRNVVVARSIRRAVDRQVRWNKIRYAFSHRMYAAELLLNPLPFALIAAWFVPLFPLLVLGARWLQLAILNRALRAGLTWKQLAAVPLLDALMLYAWFVPFFSNAVTWRGYRARIGRNTEMIEVAA
ncbi:MAG TPA: glycosyltransferase [Thermoanaerobaculia bacterium]|nr:glycosyltransferase [Thermoanaerobaculia bacterium]